MDKQCGEILDRKLTSADSRRIPLRQRDVRNSKSGFKRLGRRLHLGMYAATTAVCVAGISVAVDTVVVDTGYTKKLR